MATLHLVPHGGTFHSDDVLSTVFLRRVFSGESRITAVYHELVVRRTSDVSAYYTNVDRLKNEPIQTTKMGTHAIIYDIGRGKFDHHQSDAKTRPDYVDTKGFPIKLCGFGLLCEEYLTKYLERYLKVHEIENVAVSDVHDIFIHDFVVSVDAHDNGQKIQGIQNNISGLITRCNPTWDSEQDYDARFEYACGIAENVFDNELNLAISKAKAIPVVKEAIRIAVENNKQYCVFDRYIPSQEIILASEEANGILYIIYPSNYNVGEWVIQTLPKELGSYSSRKAFPKHLWGAPRHELIKQNWTFVHNTGFIAAALTMEDGVKLAEYAANF